MNTNGTAPTESFSGSSESSLPGTLAVAAMIVFAIVELIGTFFFHWNSGGSIPAATTRQLAHMLMIGAVVHLGTMKYEQWKASRR